MADLVLDPETMSMDDLRKAAEAEALAVSTKQPEEKQEESPIEKQEEKKAVTPFYAERSIDLGDGAGTQVFKGKGESREDALEDLSDKLADAQKHATKKIRELSKAKPVEKVVSKEDEALFSAELLASPTVAFKKLFKEVTGVDVEEFKTVTQREKVFQEAQSKKSVADQFTAAHPDYVDNDRNGKIINKWLTLHNDFTLEGFNKAYQDLSESGLLVVKDEEAGGGQEEQKQVKRIADPVEEQPSQRTRKSSGLSTQRRAVTPPPAAPSEDDMYKLPIEELRKRANQQLAGR